MAGENIWPRRKPLEAIAAGLLRVISPSRCVVRTSSRDALSGGFGLSTWLPPLGLPRVCHSTASAKGPAAASLLSQCWSDLHKTSAGRGKEAVGLKRLGVLSCSSSFLLSGQASVEKRESAGIVSEGPICTAADRAEKEVETCKDLALAN